MPIDEQWPLKGYNPQSVYPYWPTPVPYQPVTPIYPTVPQTWTTTTYSNLRNHRVRVTQAADGSWRWHCAHPCLQRGAGHKSHGEALDAGCEHLRKLAPTYTVWNRAAATSNTIAAA